MTQVVIMGRQVAYRQSMSEGSISSLFWTVCERKFVSTRIE